MKKFLLILCVMCLAMSASAYTAQEIAEAGFAWRAIGDSPYKYRGETQKIPYFLDGDVELYVDDEGDLVVSKSIPQDLFSEFGTDEVTFWLTIDGDKAYLNNGTLWIDACIDGSTTYNRNTGYSYYNTSMICLNVLWHNDDLSKLIGIIPLDDNDYPTDEQLAGTISKDEDENYIIDFGKFDIISVSERYGRFAAFSSNGNSFSGYYRDYFYFNNNVNTSLGLGCLSFHTYKPNITISEKVAEAGSNGKLGTPYNQTYSAQIKKTDNTHFYIDNWHNMGRGYKLVVPNGEVSGSNPLDKKFDKFTGEFDFDNMTLSIKADDVFTNFWSNTSYYNNGYFLMRNMGSNIRNVDGEIFADDIEGTIEPGGNICHKGKNYWRYTPTNITVIPSPQAHFDGYDFTDALVEDGYNVFNQVEHVSDITFSLVPVLGDEIEYTHQCSIQNQEFFCNPLTKESTEKYIYLRGSVSNDKNDRYVEEYDLYILPSMHHGDPDRDEHFMHEDGSEHGTWISLDKYYTSITPSSTAQTVAYAEQNLTDEEIARNLNEGTNYNLLIPEKDLNVVDPNGKYSLYVRTHYTKESGLQDTFHALTALEPTITGVASMFEDGPEAGIEVVGGQISIYGSKGNAIVTAADGRAVYRGGDATVDVAPGVYVARAGRVTKKVIVR